MLLSLGKRKRRASAETGTSTGADPAELLTDYYDVPELPDSNSAPEIVLEPRPSQPQSLFSLPNVPIDSMPPVRPALYRPVPSISTPRSLTHRAHLGGGQIYAYTRV